MSSATKLKPPVYFLSPEKKQKKKKKKEKKTNAQIPRKSALHN